MTIATQADVEALLLRPLSANEATYIADLLARADGLVFRELPGWRFTSVLNNQTATLPGTDHFETWFTGRPVVAVASVTLNGDLLRYGEDYDWHEFGDLSRTSGTKMWARTDDIDVVYSYGLAAAPEDIVAVAADLCVSAISNPTGIRQETVGQYSYTLADAAAGMALSVDQAAILNHYRYPVAI
jgi:hypothetical protein